MNENVHFEKDGNRMGIFIPGLEFGSESNAVIIYGIENGSTIAHLIKDNKDTPTYVGKFQIKL